MSNCCYANGKNRRGWSRAQPKGIYRIVLIAFLVSQAGGNNARGSARLKRQRAEGPKHCEDQRLPEVAAQQLDDGLQGRGKLLGGLFEGKNQLVLVQTDDIQQHL